MSFLYIYIYTVSQGMTVIQAIINATAAYSPRSSKICCMMYTDAKEHLSVCKGISFLRSDLESIASELLFLQQVVVKYDNHSKLLMLLLMDYIINCKIQCSSSSSLSDWCEPCYLLLLSMHADPKRCDLSRYMRKKKKKTDCHSPIQH